MFFRLLLILLAVSIYALDLTPFKNDPLWDYQSIIVNGQVIHHSSNWSGGSHVIFDRYAGIRPVLNQYGRPFKVLDIGANNGFFCIKIAEDYDAVAVAVDRNRRLGPICAANTDRKNLIALKHEITLEKLKELAKKEHFDVILALHVLHHQQDWKEWIDVFFQLGDNVIIETPPINDEISPKERTKKRIKEIDQYVTTLADGVSLGSFSRGRGISDHMIWFRPNPAGMTNQPQRVGISMETFLQFDGEFPDPQLVRERLRAGEELKGTSSLDKEAFLDILKPLATNTIYHKWYKGSEIQRTFSGAIQRVGFARKFGSEEKLWRVLNRR